MVIDPIRGAAGNRPDERNHLEHGSSPIKVEYEIDTGGRVNRVRLSWCSTGWLTAQNVAREEALRAGIHTGPFVRIEAAEQAEVFER
jgi:hypothetical protein